MFVKLEPMGRGGGTPVGLRRWDVGNNCPVFSSRQHIAIHWCCATKQIVNRKKLSKLDLSAEILSLLHTRKILHQPWFWWEKLSSAWHGKNDWGFSCCSKKPLGGVLHMWWIKLHWARSKLVINYSHRGLSGASWKRCGEWRKGCSTAWCYKCGATS